MTVLALIRLVLAGVCLLAASTAVIIFPSLFFWKVTLAVGEYGHRLLIAPLVLMVWCRLDGSIGSRPTLVLAGLAALLMVLPLLRALPVAARLPGDLRLAFPGVAVVGSPLKFQSLFFGRSPRPSVPERISLPTARLLFYRSEKPTASPCIIVLHSGGWEKGVADEFPAWTAHWNSRGYAVASVEYRLAPEHPWPAQREDVEGALDYLMQNASALGIRSDAFVLFGRSAGGQIASACAFGIDDPAIVGCVSLYGPADMNFAWEFADPKDVLDSPRLLRQYLGGTPDELPEVYQQASAFHLAKPTSPPTLLIHGERDTLVWAKQSQRLSDRLAELDVAHFYLRLPWAAHAFDFPFHGPGSQLTRCALDTFLDHFTRPKPDGNHAQIAEQPSPFLGGGQ